MTTPERTTSDQLAEDRTDFAAKRTVMAADRTLMAWVRTGLAMTSFGFTIYKVLQAFQSAGSILPHENSPRRIGLFLTALGTVSILMGSIEYWQTLRDMRGEYVVRVWRPAFVIALLLSLLSLFLFVSIFIRVL